MPVELLVAVVDHYREEEEPQLGGLSVGVTYCSTRPIQRTPSVAQTILPMILSMGMMCFVEGCFLIPPLYVR
jgi:hypothetical protein